MLEFLTKSNGIRRTVFHAQTAESTHRQMIDVLIDDSHLFPFRGIDPDGDHLDGAVWTVVFTDAATIAPMLVIGVMRHDDLPFEPVVHF